MPINYPSPYGHPKSTNAGGVVTRAPFSAATMTALKAVASDDAARTHGNEVVVDADGSRWYYHATSTLTGDDVLVATPSDSPTEGRWIRSVGRVCLELPISHSMGDHTALLTLPTGAVLKLDSSHWRITTGFTGGSSSAIGVQSTTLSTAGDILGGSSGELTAAIGTAGRKTGTIGAKMDSVAEMHANLFVAGEVFYYEKITDTYAAGAGFVCLVGDLIANAGA